MRWIKDSIHGDVFISSIAGELLDTETMQRLRRVAQTSFSNMIYPGANHTRFEHSIGTYYLMSRGCFLNHLPKPEGSKLVIAALLHDIGHSAFSHALEGVMEKHTGKNHEEHTKEKIIGGKIAEVLGENGVSPDSIASIYDKPIGKAILGYLGTDKMDYLLRDSYYTGVAYGSVDADRILRKLIIRDDGVLLEEKGVSAAEAMLMARFLMYSNIYFHPVAKSTEVMLVRAAEASIAAGNTRAEELTQLDDWQLMSRLADGGGLAAELAGRLQARKIYKSAAQQKMKDFRNWLYLGDMGEKEMHEAEESIAEKAGIGADEVMLYIPRPWFRDVGIRVLKGGDYYSLDETSLITRLLKEAQWDYMNVIAFCPGEHREAVGAVGLKFLEDYGGGTWQ
ncbi:MAG: HD domain-containing protein [Candidatus Diapherotrites archaeon]|nr:HD domain-containing protein [Candidatus Diapherotrites archaeon]